MANYRLYVDKNVFTIEKTPAAVKIEDGIFLTLAEAKSGALMTIDKMIADLKHQRRSIRALQDKDVQVEIPF